MARIYFAHPVTVFDTKLEKQMRNRILASFLGAEIEDPNQPHHQQGYAEWKKKLVLPWVELLKLMKMG